MAEEVLEVLNSIRKVPADHLSLTGHKFQALKGVQKSLLLRKFKGILPLGLYGERPIAIKLHFVGPVWC